MRTKGVVESKLIIHEKGIYRPEPTRFWILERELRSAISALESEGWIRKLSLMITSDHSLFDHMIKLHRLEVKKRKEILEREYPHILSGEGKWDRICRSVLLNPEVGLGGIRNFDAKPFKVRCLHLWTAYHLGDPDFENPIGKFVLSRI